MDGLERIGAYTIEREIGRGGMGVVHFATDSRLGRRVAIKALPEHLAEDPDRLARFDREARALASLNHANVAQIYGLEEAVTVETEPRVEFSDRRTVLTGVDNAWVVPMPDGRFIRAKLAEGSGEQRPDIRLILNWGLGKRAP